MPKATALIIDDEQDIRELIEMAFMSMDIHCVLSPTVNDAINQLKKYAQKLDFCITDMRLPDGDGLDLVVHIQKKYPQLPVCVITAHGNVELAVTALKRGAFDFVNKPFDLEQLRAMAKAALKLSQSQQKAVSLNDSSPSGNKQNSHEVKLIGNSPVMKKLEKIIVRLARSQAPVFIYGESGTGKELVARRIHQKSARRDNAFIPVNCGAIPENLVESEFFGYKKGAFTGANSDHDGLFIAAHGGTLFLDEVADLPLSMQVKLLRAIQERAIRPIGGDSELPVDVRILSATHKNLEKLVTDHEFREDLYYRLNVISLGMPPLRRRRGDVEVLASFILEKLVAVNGKKSVTLTPAALAKLNAYKFPGNVRELENILERAITFCDDSQISPNDIRFSTQIISEVDDDLSIDLSDADHGDDDGENDDDSYSDDGLNGNTPTTPPKEEPEHLNPEHLNPEHLKNYPSSHHSASHSADENITDLDRYIADVERQAIEKALKANQNNKAETAEKLGLSLRALRYKLKKYQINRKNN